jgi:hypothetical protein
VIQAAAPSLAVEVTALNVHNIGEIESAVAGFARGANGGLIGVSSLLALRSRSLIVGLEHFRLDVNRNSNRGFPRACKSDSGCSDGNGGVARWPGDIRTT